MGFVTENTNKDFRRKDDIQKYHMDDFYENVKTCIKAVILKLNQRYSWNSVLVRSSIVF